MRTVPEALVLLSSLKKGKPGIGTGTLLSSKAAGGMICELGFGARVAQQGEQLVLLDDTALEDEDLTYALGLFDPEKKRALFKWIRAIMKEMDPAELYHARLVDAGVIDEAGGTFRKRFELADPQQGELLLEEATSARETGQAADGRIAAIAALNWLSSKGPALELARSEPLLAAVFSMVRQMAQARSQGGAAANTIARGS